LSDLVLQATVEAIENSPVGIRGAFLDWIIHTRVVRVIEGSFEAPTFSFRVHSPSRALIEQGMTITIRASKVPDGWRVDSPQ